MRENVVVEGLGIIVAEIGFAAAKSVLIFVPLIVILFAGRPVYA